MMLLALRLSKVIGNDWSTVGLHGFVAGLLANINRVPQC
jgi:hypothetical protein